VVQVLLSGLSKLVNGVKWVSVWLFK